LLPARGNKYQLNNHLNNFAEQPLLFETINAIPLPRGYARIASEKNSFGEWLRAICLKKDNHVYLYNGSLKKNQSAQFAVLDVAIGEKDLQQCADAVMRLRAEYLFDLKRYTEIVFKDNNGKPYAWNGGDDKTRFADYLENVFACCGTASLEKQLKPVNELQKIQSGDVFIKGGFPGHAMIVVDVAVNKEGKKIFMLAQSYMPAQDIHIVKNPGNEILSPWYETGEEAMIITPEWKFKQNQLYKW
jgi:hypothetical protein